MTPANYETIAKLLQHGADLQHKTIIDFLIKEQYYELTIKVKDLLLDMNAMVINAKTTMEQTQ